MNPETADVAFAKIKCTESRGLVKQWRGISVLAGPK